MAGSIGHVALARPGRCGRAERAHGLARVPRIATLCRLWRNLFPIKAPPATVAAILADIAPFMARRRGDGGARKRAPVTPGRLRPRIGAGAACARVPVAARTGSWR